MRANLALFLFVTALGAYAQDKPRLIHRLDGSTLTPTRAASIAATELTADHVTGAQIAILNHGHVVWTYAYGLRNVEQHLPMTTGTNLWAASITKAVFATWAMHLVEQGKLNLDEPIAKILPHPLDSYEPYRKIAAALVKDPRWPTVTPRMLLAHTSGLANLFELEPDGQLHLHFTPGTRYAYSGDGLNLLQFAIEQKLGEPLDLSMQRDIFAPLAMSRTGMVWRADFDSDAALRYDAWGKLIGATHRTSARGAGSMATTLDDLDRFLEAFLADRILKPATRTQMLTPQIAISQAQQFPTLNESTSPEGPRVGLAYGLGWGLLTRTRFGPAFFKEGHGNGAENYLICFTRTADCMVLLTNSDNGELAFRPLLEQLFGDTVTPWQWQLYTREQVLHNEEHTQPK